MRSNKSPIRRCVAMLLAATYLVVGAGGEGLFYLLELPSTTAAGPFSAVPDGHPHEVVAHQHGDGYWHRHSSRVAAGLTQERSPRADRVAISERSWFHQDHTCFLLALSSAIELSHTADAHCVCRSVDRLHSRLDGDNLEVTVLRSNLGARGPPAATLA